MQFILLNFKFYCYINDLKCPLCLSCYLMICNKKMHRKGVNRTPAKILVMFFTKACFESPIPDSVHLPLYFFPFQYVPHPSVFSTLNSFYKLCSVFFIYSVTFSSFLKNIGLPPSPRWQEISGFCSFSGQHLSMKGCPNDSSLTQLTPWIRKGLEKSHQYYLTLRTTKRRGGGGGGGGGGVKGGGSQVLVWVVWKRLDGV